MGNLADEELSPRSITPFLVHLLAQEEGLSLAITEESDVVIFRVENA